MIDFIETPLWLAWQIGVFELLIQLRLTRSRGRAVYARALNITKPEQGQADPSLTASFTDALWNSKLGTRNSNSKLLRLRHGRRFHTNNLRQTFFDREPGIPASFEPNSLPLRVPK